MLNNHPIIPSSELIRQWKEAPEFSVLSPCTMVTTTTTKLQDIAIQAAQWGADMELDACCEWLDRNNQWARVDIDELRDSRRPAPAPVVSKQSALEILGQIDEQLRLPSTHFNILFHAIQQLPE